MASQQVKGFGSTRRATDADKARNVSQNTENLYNAALVDWAFEDASIQASKIIGGVGATPAITYDATYTTSLVSTNATVTNNQSVAIGIATAGSRAIAIGPSGTIASGTRSIAIGYGTYATQEGALAIGRGAGAYGTLDVSIGNNSYGSAGYTHMTLVGAGTQGFGTDATALGSDARVYATRAIAIGNEATVFSSGTDGIAIGFRADVVGVADGIAIGKNAKVRAAQAIVIGPGLGVNSTYVDTGATRAIAIGYYAQVRATATSGIAIGYAAIVRTSVVNSISLGKSVDNAGSNSILIGANTDNNNARENVIGEGITGGGASTFRLGVSATNHFTFSSWTAAAGLLAVTHSLPVQINGVTFNMLLNQ
jgi:hypothetical protein